MPQVDAFLSDLKKKSIFITLTSMIIAQGNPCSFKTIIKVVAAEKTIKDWNIGYRFIGHVFLNTNKKLKHEKIILLYCSTNGMLGNK